MLERKLTDLEVKKSPTNDTKATLATQINKKSENHDMEIEKISEKYGISLKLDRFESKLDNLYSIKTKKEEINNIKLKSIEKSENTNYSLKLNSIINIDSTGGRSSEPIVLKSVKNNDISDFENRFNAIENDLIRTTF